MNSEQLSSFIHNTIETHSAETATIIIMEELAKIAEPKADKANGRQNPVADKFRTELDECTEVMYAVAILADKLIDKGQIELGKDMKRVWLHLGCAQRKLAKLC